MNYLFRLAFCASMVVSARESFVLPRVHFPDQRAIQDQAHEQNIRKISKYLKGVSATVGLGTILYFAYQIHQHAVRIELESAFLEQEKRLHAIDKKLFEKYCTQKTIIDKNVSNVQVKDLSMLDVQSSSVENGLFQQFFSNVKSFGWSSSKFVADSILLIVSSSVANCVYEYMKHKINQAFSEDTIFWYISEHTKLSWIFSDLKTYAVDYDIYASVLSAELFNQDAHVQMKALLKDLHQVVLSNASVDDLQSSTYWTYLFDEVKKKYIKKSSNFEQRQDFVDMALIKQHRIVQDQDAIFLFIQDMNRRYAMHQFCNYCAQDMQKLINFISFKIHVNSLTSEKACFVQELVDLTNNFLEYMQILLNSSLDELTALSKQDKGMFTSVYEFEKIFNEQMSFLHRYCKYSR